jgi:hypothetical protein
MDAREPLHRITQHDADNEQRRGVGSDGARPLGREAEKARSNQQKRQSSADLLLSGMLPKCGAIGEIADNFSVNAATGTAASPLQFARMARRTVTERGISHWRGAP